MPEQKEFEQLKKEFEQLQLRVTRFSAIEQELINTRDKLDQELVLYKRLNDFNRSALSDMPDREFARLLTESIIDILEVESSFVFLFHEDLSKCQIAAESSQLDENKAIEGLHKYFQNKDIKKLGQTEVFHNLTHHLNSNELKFRDGHFYTVYDQVLKAGMLIAIWNSVENAPLYRELKQREKTIFSLFSKQANSVFINRVKNEKIKNQLEQIQSSQLELSKLSMIATRTKNGVIISNNRGEIEWVNDAFSNITGYELNEVIGKKPKDFLQGQVTTEEDRNLMSRKLNEKKPVEITLLNVRKDGSTYFNNLEIKPIFNERGELANFIALQRDITNEIQFQEELLRMNSRYELISEKAEIGIWESNLKTGKVTWNNVLLNQFGIKEKNPTNLYQVWVDNIHPEDREIVLNKSEIIHSGKSDHIALKYRIIKNGTSEIRYLNCLIIGEKDSQNNLIRMIGSSIDETEERTYLHVIEEKNNAIAKINLELTEMVQEETQKNLSLARTLNDQEKLVTIGEIASGIAHDLNTPLGSIKIGAENIRDTFENLFIENLHGCTEEEIAFAIHRALNKEVELFVGGMKRRKEIQELELAFKQKKSSYPLNRSLVDGLVKCRFTANNFDEIDFVLARKNPEGFLKLIYQLQSINGFIRTILSSAEKSSTVIQDMRNYIKTKKVEGKMLVNLKNNIQSVLNIFNYEVKRKAEIEFEVDDSLNIHGIDVHLFQLWANLIKNALEAFEKEKEGNYVKIYSESYDGKIMIAVENNGPEIPVSIQSKIFDKFYTTKETKNGTGLGLSIVRKIIEEHNAILELSSSKEKTVFKIYFNN